MCENFFDIRAFGAVMSTTEFNCGQVRGPVQLTFGRSIDRVFTTEHTISRQAFTGEKDIKAGTGTFGRKHTIAYGLYRAHGFINPVFAKQTGFSDDDLGFLWRALGNMFDLDRSAARGLMSARELFVFKHKSALGEAPAHKLFESVSARLKEGVVSPRSFNDYLLSGPESSALPAGVELLVPLALPAAA
jgi:CRISPR-associated protein Csd2